jgi:post-segregation antitoxin (ccd killing protein)
MTSWLSGRCRKSRKDTTGARQRFEAAKAAVLQQKSLADIALFKRARRKSPKQWQKEQLSPAMVGNQG